MVRHLASVIALAAPVVLAQCNKTATQNTSYQLLISGSGYIWSASFDGTSVVLQNNISEPGVTPSWLLEGKGENSFIANDENSNTTDVYTFGASSNTSLTGPSAAAAAAITPAQTYTTGSTGVVHLAYNTNKTLLFGAAYGAQAIDIWDTTAPDNTLTHAQTIPIANTSSKPHQTVVSPAGNIAIVNDLGLDALHILDTTSPATTALTSSIPVPAGCGPRHGAFYRAPAAAFPSRYLVACETAHTLLVYNLTATGTLAPNAQPLQEPLQTAVDVSGASLTAAELLLLVNADASADVYVSNRLTGGATDSIAHFRLPAGSSGQPGDVAALAAADLVSSGGVGPRGMAASADGAFLFVGNQKAGPAGVVVLARDGETGALGASDGSPVATVGFAEVAGGEGEAFADFGPQFVMEWTGIGGSMSIMKRAKGVVRRW